MLKCPLAPTRLALLLIAASLGCHRSGRTVAPSRGVNLLPRAPGVIASIDLAALRRSKLGELMARQLPFEPALKERWAELVGPLPLAAARDVERLAIAVRDDGPAGESVAAIAEVSSSFGDGWVKQILGDSVESRAVGSHTIYRRATAPTWFLLVDAHTIALGDPRSLEEIAVRADQGSDGILKDPKLAPLVRRVDPSAVAWAVVTAPIRFQERSSAHSSVASLGATTGLKIDLQFDLDTLAQAQLMARRIDRLRKSSGILAMVGLQPLAAPMKVTVANETLHITTGLDGTELEGLIAGMATLQRSPVASTAP